LFAVDFVLQMMLVYLFEIEGYIEMSHCIEFWLTQFLKPKAKGVSEQNTKKSLTESNSSSAMLRGVSIIAFRLNTF